MLERLSLSIGLATIVGVLAKLASLYHTDKESGNDWLSASMSRHVWVFLLLSAFLILFRGKMMHDDSIYFSDLKTNGVFKADLRSQRLIRIGVLLGYISWLLWAPAIYFLDDLPRFAGFMFISLCISTIWLPLDILTRVKMDWRRAFWVIPNSFYLLSFGIIFVIPDKSVYAAGLLLLTLIIDWLVSDPFHGHVNSEP